MPIPLSAISPCDNGPALNLTLLLAIPHIKILEAGGGDICSRNVLSDGAGGISGAADGANPAKTPVKDDLLDRRDMDRRKATTTNVNNPEAKRKIVEGMFCKEPTLGQELNEARGLCKKFQPKSKRRCGKGMKCPCLHVHEGQDKSNAPNRFNAPFCHVTRDNKLLVMPPYLLKALKYWWTETLKQQTPCPIEGVDVERRGDSQVVILTFAKSSPSSLAQDCAGKSWIHNDDGAVIKGSTVEIPKNRTWYHDTHMKSFTEILTSSLQAGPEGTFKGVYSVGKMENCEACGDRFMVSFKSYGMVAKLTRGCTTPKTIPEGIIGYFDSGTKRQWIHHPRNLQLMYAELEYCTFCLFFAEAFANIPGELKYSPKLHTALVQIAGLVVPAYEKQNEYDYAGPHGAPQGSYVDISKNLDDDQLKKKYDKGFGILDGRGGKKYRGDFEETRSFNVLKLMWAWMEASVVIYNLRFHTFRANFVPCCCYLLKLYANCVTTSYQLCANCVPTLFQ